MRVFYLYYGFRLYFLQTHKREDKKIPSDNTEETWLRDNLQKSIDDFRYFFRFSIFFFDFRLLFRERDFHRRVGGNLEALESVASRGRLNFVLELDEGDVVTAGNQSNLFEAGELKKTKKVNEPYRTFKTLIS